MKRFLLLSILAAVPVLCQAAWSPSVSVSAFYHGTEVDQCYDSSGALRNSLGFSGEINPLALSIGRHRISLPVTLSYITKSQTVSRTLVDERYECSLSAEYGYRFHRRFSLSLSLDMRLSVFPLTSSTLWRSGLTLKSALKLAKHLEALVPVSFVIGEAETAFTCGLALRALWGGWK